MAAAARQNRLTKPQGSLGRLEALAITLAGHQGTEHPVADLVSVVVFAADHGIADEGVSAFPAEVTGQMLANYLGGGAAISVLARVLDASLTVVDMGTRSAAALPGLSVRRIARGTRNFAHEPAMDADQMAAALAAGADVVDALAPRPQLLVLGEMGIANTTSAAALAAALLGRAPSDLVGAGTGVDVDTVQRKAALIAAAFEREGVSSAIEAPEALRLFGGFEIAALAGAMVRAAQLGISIVVDGFIASVAAHCAVDLNGGVRPWLLFAHRSSERGHGLVLDALAAEPLLNLGLRLGEGSGGALAVPLLRLACDLHNGMATFDEAAVTNRS
jgi:nicotinate-nucleotide--dimethylbenzimidazole phosphoribosyltransferase